MSNPLAIDFMGKSNTLPGALIVVEGIDGSGKGTVMSKLVSMLEHALKDARVVETKEPGGTRLGNLVRKLIFEDYPIKDMADGVVDTLFLASHLQNQSEVVIPALSGGHVVVSDRWWYSNLAYARLRNAPPAINYAYFTCRGVEADLFIFLGADPEVAIKRANSRTTETHQQGKPWNSANAQDQIQEYYLKFFGKNSNFFFVDTTDLTPDEVWLQVEHGVRVMLNKKGIEIS